MLQFSVKGSRVRTAALALLLAGTCFSQVADLVMRPDVRRVGDKLACKCGACNNTVATCQMLQCHYADPARKKIAASLDAGEADQKIVDGFVKESGLSALAVPPAEGFSLLGWAMPFVMIGLGLGAITLYVRRFRKPVLAPAPEIAPEVMDKYRERIDKDLAKLD